MSEEPATNVWKIALGVFLGNLAFAVLATCVVWFVLQDLRATAEAQQLTDSINAQAAHFKLLREENELRNAQ